MVATLLGFQSQLDMTLSQSSLLARKFKLHAEHAELHVLQDKDMVAMLLEMKLQLDVVLTQAFQKNEQFGNALKEAFEKFINQRQNK